MPCLSFPHIAWWEEALRSGPDTMIYSGKPYRNTGYRNRYKIATANGPLLLSIPLKGGRRAGASLSETAIDYTHAWQRQHWRTLFSAYGRAPFFEHYGSELESQLFSGHKWLLDFNLAAIEWICKSLQLNIVITITEVLPADADVPYGLLARPDATASVMPYHQVFEDRLGFLPNLSIVDLLMAEGPYASAYLKKTR